MSNSKQFIINANGQVTGIYEIEHGQREREYIDYDETYYVLTDTSGAPYVVKIEGKNRYVEWELYAPNQTRTLWHPIREGYGSDISARTLARFGLTEAWDAAFGITPLNDNITSANIVTNNENGDFDNVGTPSETKFVPVYIEYDNQLDERYEGTQDPALEAQVYSNDIQQDADLLSELSHVENSSSASLGGNANEDNEVFKTETGDVVLAQEIGESVIFSGEEYFEARNDTYISLSGKILRDFEPGEAQVYSNDIQQDADLLSELSHVENSSSASLGGNANEDNEVFKTETGDVVLAQEIGESVIFSGEEYFEAQNDTYISLSGKILRDFEPGESQEYRTHTNGHFELREDGIYEVNDTATAETKLYGYNSLTIADLQNHQLLQKSDDIVRDGRVVGMKIHDHDNDDLDDNFLIALDGDDYLDGRNGNDWIFAERGNDTALGGNGDDIIFGGDGNDLLLDSWGADKLSGDAGDDIIISFEGGDTIDAGEGADTLYGGRGHDIINGGRGNDILYGDTVLFASRGDDVLEGGEGDDILQGGFGADTFVFNAGSDGNDIICRIGGGADFESGIDQVQLVGFSVETTSDVLSHISDVGGKAVFDAEGVTITFDGLLSADIDVNDFVFL